MTSSTAVDPASTSTSTSAPGGNGQPSGHPAWDATALVKLVGSNQPMQQRLLTRFLLTAADTLARIEAVHATGDLPELTRLAHSLKSAARSVGAVALGEHCWVLESAGRAGDLAACQALARKLPGLFSAASSLIQAHLVPNEPVGVASS